MRAAKSSARTTTSEHWRRCDRRRRRWRAKRRCGKNDQRFRLLVEGVQDYAIFMLDRGGNISSWNEGARRIKGYEASEIVGRHFSCFYPEEDVRAGIPQMELRAATDVGRFEDEGWRLRKDGTRFWANVIITAIHDADGNLCGFSKVTRDTTERMKAQEVLRANRDALKKEVEERMAAEARLQDSEASLRILSRNLFHVQDEERRHVGRELHETIGQYLSALKMELDSLQFEPALQDRGVRHQLEGSIGLVEQCIKEVRTMSYLLYPPLLEEMGLKMAIPWYVNGFARRSGIQTRLQMSRDFGRLPRSVELVLFRVLQECLTNVHRHSGSPTALIRVFVENEAAVIEIIDSGKGLPTGVLEFGQKNAFNVGIGLRGMNERVKGVGGKLELSSAGNGTTVRVSVPSSSTQAEEARAIH